MEILAGALQERAKRRAISQHERWSKDPIAFAEEGLGFKPIEWQRAVLTTQARSLALNCSRQAGKSTVTAIVALWTALYQPHALVLLVSPSDRQSRELFAKVQEFLRMVNGAPARLEDNKTSMQLANGSRVVSLPSSPDTIRGFSAVSLLIEDEAAFVDDEVFVAIRAMLVVSGGKLMLLSTPNGKSGHFYEAWENGGPNWERIQIKYTDCPYIRAEELEKAKGDLSSFQFRQEFECEFIQTEDAFFAHEVIEGMSKDVQIADAFDIGRPL